MSCIHCGDQCGCAARERIKELQAEVARLKALMSEALGNMEYYPASLGEYWLVQNIDIDAMQTALEELRDE